MALLKKYRDRAAMEAACRHTADSLCFRLPHIPHTVVVMVMALTFRTKDPGRVGDSLNIFLFTDLSPSAGSKMALLTQKWYAILGGGTLTSFTYKNLLMVNQKVAPIVGWEKAASQLEVWPVFCTVFLEYDRAHPAIYKMFLLLEDSSGVRQRLRTQARHQPTFPAVLLCLIQ